MSNKNLISNNGIETINQLIFHLTKLSAAYRKSYKFCGRINTGLQIMAGIFGCSATLALIPAVPVFVVVVGVVPSLISLVINKIKVYDKKNILKEHHNKIKQIITKTRIVALTISGVEEEKKVIQDVFETLLEMQKEKDYIIPFEKYMKEFELNGYEKINNNI